MNQDSKVADSDSASLRTGRPDTPREYRALIWNFTRSNLKSRFRGTALGWAWSLVAPLATILIYSVVFSVFIRVQPPPYGNGNPGNYAVWLITGMVTWQFISQVLLNAMPSLLGNGGLLRKVYFPSFVPVIATAIAVGIQSLIELGIVLSILLAVTNASWTWLLVPLWGVAVWLFALSASYVLAVANVYWRDLFQISGVLLQLLFFLSPIIFPITFVPEQLGPIPARLLVELNPIAQFIIVGRELMYELILPSLAQVGYLAAWTGAMLLLSRWVWRRWGQDIGEAV